MFHLTEFCRTNKEHGAKQLNCYISWLALVAKRKLQVRAPTLIFSRCWQKIAQNAHFKDYIDFFWSYTIQLSSRSSCGYTKISSMCCRKLLTCFRYWWQQIAQNVHFKVRLFWNQTTNLICSTTCFNNILAIFRCWQQLRRF